MKRLDPEIKAMRAIQRALEPLDDQQRKRVLEWRVAFELQRGWFTLPAFFRSQTGSQA